MRGWQADSAFACERSRVLFDSYFVLHTGVEGRLKSASGAQSLTASETTVQATSTKIHESNPLKPVMARFGDDHEHRVYMSDAYLGAVFVEDALLDALQDGCKKVAVVGGGEYWMFNPIPCEGTRKDPEPTDEFKQSVSNARAVHSNSLSWYKFSPSVDIVDFKTFSQVFEPRDLGQMCRTRWSIFAEHDCIIMGVNDESGCVKRKLLTGIQRCK